MIEASIDAPSGHAAAPLKPRAADLAIAAALLAVSEAELWVVAHTDGHSRPVSAAALVVMSFAVAIRRTMPFTAVIVCMSTLVVQEALHGAITRDLTIALLFPAVVMYTAGSRLVGRRAVGALAIAVALVAVDALVGDSSSGLTFSLMLIALPWAFGQLLGDRSRRAAAFQRLAHELELQRAGRVSAAVDRERARITGELHDVIAHSVSVMTLQVAGARAAMSSDRERAASMVLAAEETGREALSDIRRVLGILRTYDDPRALTPQPGIDQLDQLIAHSRRDGLAAELRVDGTPGAITPGVDLAAYRIVEAALEQLESEPRAASAEVTVHWQPAELVLLIAPAPWRHNGEIASHVRTATDPLAAIRERVELYDGRLEVTGDPGGSSLLTATLPLRRVPA